MVSSRLLRCLRVPKARQQQYLLHTADGTSPDEQLEKLVFGRFMSPDARKVFFEAYKELEALWEILSPSAELRDHIDPYRQLARRGSGIPLDAAGVNGYWAVAFGNSQVGWLELDRNDPRVLMQAGFALGSILLSSNNILTISLFPYQKAFFTKILSIELNPVMKLPSRESPKP